MRVQHSGKAALSSREPHAGFNDAAGHVKTRGCQHDALRRIGAHILKVPLRYTRYQMLANLSVEQDHTKSNLPRIVHEYHAITYTNCTAIHSNGRRANNVTGVAYGQNLGNR
eukprot:9486609-Pyramimonas_sp.AAC.1